MRTTTAAALFAESAEWEVVELEVDPPRAGEVQVRFDFVGLCRSDEHLRFGSAGRFPIVGGHEGSPISGRATTWSAPSCPPAAGAGGA